MRKVKFGGGLIAAAIALNIIFVGIRLANADTVQGGVILTIAGKIDQTNRGGFDPKRDAFLKYHDVKFSKAMSFDRAALLKLAQREVKASTGFYGELSTYKGPALGDVIELVGAKGFSSIKFLALDGYAVELSADDIAAKDWIIALSRNDTPLALGGLGPLLILHTPLAKNGRVSKREEEKWAWALFYMEVK